MMTEDTDERLDSAAATVDTGILGNLGKITAITEGWKTNCCNNQLPKVYLEIKEDAIEDVMGLPLTSHLCPSC